MCGIAGILDPSERDADALRALVERMATSLRHRGPDDGGAWVDASVGMALGHRRLAIVDLTPAGHQPMVSVSGGSVISFNGEIYNHRRLRSELEAAGHRFRSATDTEVILAAVEQWGSLEALRRMDGMFAFALWDKAQRRLLLARDRMGEKPLFYAWNNGRLLFGSELKALAAHPCFTRGVDRAAVASYLRYGYVPCPGAILASVRKLPPGAFLLAAPGEEPPAPTLYWSAKQVAFSRVGERSDRADRDGLVERLDTTLREVIRDQLVADVPVGAFLSGGIDSSTVAAIAAAVSGHRVRTFSIGFGDRDHDEAPFAAAVARHLGTEHTELYASAEDALAVVPELPRMYDEPIGDSSQIPTHLVARLARASVTVGISGDGGDELFAGYGRYPEAARLARRYALVPSSIRRAIGGALGNVPEWVYDVGLAPLRVALPSRAKGRSLGDKAHAWASRFAANTPIGTYRSFVTHWDGDPARLTVDDGGTAFAEDLGAMPRAVERMMLLDQQTYLPDDILVKVDRASMAVGLETRVPLLDRRIVELAWSIPLDLNLHAGIGKRILRGVLARYVPPALTERPKRGFAVPLASWLRGPLRSWASDLLEESRLRREGFLDAARVASTWRDHLSGRRNAAHLLWDVLMFEAWLTNSDVV